MRLPRWVVILLAGLSCATVVLTACTVWVAWPNRTAREFVRVMNEVPLEAEQYDVGALLVILETIGVQSSAFQEEAIVFRPRSASDLFLGRRTFTVTGVPCEFTAERGRISYSFTETQ